MEIFIRNVPASFTDRGLSTQLLPFTQKLGIRDGSFACEKARKKHIGHVTFSNPDDGVRFLKAYGQIDPPSGRGQPKPRLNLLGTDVFCDRSKRKADPIT